MEARVALVMDPSAHLGVERAEDLATRGKFGCHRHSHWGPNLSHHLGVVQLVRQVTFVEDHKAHHVKRDVDVPALLRAENPAGGDPTPWAQWFEPEIDAGIFGHRAALSLRLVFL